VVRSTDAGIAVIGVSDSIPLAHETFYLGDPAAVFPVGTGVLDGQNIPVRAGRYLVRFNTRTFEYQLREAHETTYRCHKPGRPQLR
jgi:hypothetical protein